VPPMEIFTISGAAGFGVADSASPVWNLQNALKALGSAHGDPILSSVGIDGKMGSKTVAAVNYALKTYIGAQAAQDFHLSGRFLNATATMVDVQQGLGQLVALVTRTVKLQGGSVPTPPAHHVSSGSSSSSIASKEDQGQTQDPTTDKSKYLPWIIGGAAIIVAFLGFTAVKRRA
jgi:lysozyme family protein